MTARIVAALLLLTLAPSLVHADPESLHALTPTPVVPPPAALDPGPTRRELLTLQPHVATRLEHAHTRVVTGRALTLGGLAALVIAFGVGVPLIHAAYADGGANQTMVTAGISIATIFGALGGSGVTAGPVLWQMGATDEARLRDGEYDGYTTLRRRRLVGGLLLGLGAIGEVLAIVGAGLWTSNLDFGDGCCSGSNSGRANVGFGLIFGGTALAAIGFTTGSTYIAAAGRDRKIMLSVAGGGLRMTF